MSKSILLTFLFLLVLWVVFLPVHYFLYRWKKKSLEWPRIRVQLFSQFSVLSLFVLPTHLMSVALAGIIFWGVREFVYLLPKGAHSTPLKIVYLIGPTLIPIVIAYANEGLLFFFIGLLCLFWLFLLMEKPAQNTFECLGHFSFIVTTASMLSLLLLLHKRPQGFELCVFAYSIAASNDIIAYIIGGSLGKVKIAPQISPGKSLEGILASLAFTIALAFFIWKYLLYEYSLSLILGAAFLMSITAHLGDLAFSTVKRCIGTKDFSALLPGIGGIWDLLDSLIFATPILYLVLILNYG